MAKRGRKSSAEMESNLRVLPTRESQRPDPPDELTDRQAEIWRSVVSSETDTWFETAALQSMLADFCRHKEAGEKISEVIDVFKSDWLKNEDGARRYKDLLKMRADETRVAASLAGKMRLTNQSRYTPQAAGTAVKNKTRLAKPWEM